jgi:hypothetical protein
MIYYLIGMIIAFILSVVFEVVLMEKFAPLTIVRAAILSILSWITVVVLIIASFIMWNTIRQNKKYEKQQKRAG